MLTAQIKSSGMACCRLSTARIVWVRPPLTRKIRKTSDLPSDYDPGFRRTQRDGLRLP